MANQSVTSNSNLGNNNKPDKINDTDVNKKQQKFYDSENHLVLPRTAECYFNWKSSQSNDIPLNARLKELGFVLSQGFNLKDFIFSYKSDRESYTNSSISQTLIFYIMYIRYRDYYHFVSEILSTLSVNKLVQIFLYELNLVYDPLTDDITCMFWNDNDVLEAAKALEGNQSEKEKLLNVITDSKMIKAAFSKDSKED